MKERAYSLSVSQWFRVGWNIDCQRPFCSPQLHKFLLACCEM